jgi:hypothetical protein
VQINWQLPGDAGAAWRAGGPKHIALSPAATEGFCKCQQSFVYHCLAIQPALGEPWLKAGPHCQQKALHQAQHNFNVVPVVRAAVLSGGCCGKGGTACGAWRQRQRLENED